METTFYAIRCALCESIFLSDEVCQISDEISDEVCQISDEVCQISDEVGQISDEVGQISDEVCQTGTLCASCKDPTRSIEWEYTEEGGLVCSSTNQQPAELQQIFPMELTFYSFKCALCKYIFLSDEACHTKTLCASCQDQQLSDANPYNLPPPTSDTLLRYFKLFEGHQHQIFVDIKTTVGAIDKQTRNMPTSHVGRSHWTVTEKNTFFRGVERFGKWDVRKIANLVGTKSVVECGIYLQLLEQGLKTRPRGLQRVKLEQYHRQISAREVSDAWVAFEEREATRVERKLERKEIAKVTGKSYEWWEQKAMTEKERKGLEMFRLDYMARLTTTVYVQHSDAGVFRSTVLYFHAILRAWLARVIHDAIVLAEERNRAGPKTRKLLMRSDVAAALHRQCCTRPLPTMSREEYLGGMARRLEKTVVDDDGVEIGDEIVLEEKTQPKNWRMKKTGVWKAKEREEQMEEVEGGYMDDDAGMTRSERRRKRILLEGYFAQRVRKKLLLEEMYDPDEDGMTRAQRNIKRRREKKLEQQDMQLDENLEEQYLRMDVEHEQELWKRMGVEKPRARDF